jgi:hypothetical protein
MGHVALTSYGPPGGQNLGFLGVSVASFRLALGLYGADFHIPAGSGMSPSPSRPSLLWTYI